jgi:hypothetical protein
MAQRTQTRLTLKNLPILLRSGDPSIVCFDGGGGLVRADARDSGPVPKRSPTPDVESFTALGFRQTVAAANKGGTANANGFRFRNESMRSLARSFRGQPFLTGHDRGDVRARGGTIRDAYLEQLDASAEVAILYDIDAVADWAKDGLANGTIDRFSIGASRGDGEIVCTVHGAPVFVECVCFPGEAVEYEGDEMIAEWEYQDPIGMELSAVNVPAVLGTFVVEATASEAEIERYVSARVDLARQLAEVCGRSHPHIANMTEGGWLPRGFTAARGRRTIAACRPAQELSMDPREQMAKALGLPITATWEEITAKQAQVTAEANVARAQLDANGRELEAARSREIAAERERDAAHVEAEITRLTSVRQVSAEVVAELRATGAAQGSRAAFDRSVALVERTAPERLQAPSAGGGRAALQSDAAAARTDAAAGGAAMPTEPDAYEQHASNPELPKLMRACRLTPDDVRAHGPRQIAVVHNLGDLINATNERG